MEKLFLSIIFLSFAMISSLAAQPFDLQGHRGCRGLMPENSIPGFLKAIDLGVQTLELDVVISGDGKVVVSHDPFFSADFCLNELGLPLTKSEEKTINIYELDYEDITMFDCGSKGNRHFPEQQNLSTYKPLLVEMLKACEEYAVKNNLKPLRYNIELKSEKAGDNLYHPEPTLFTKLVYDATVGIVPPERFNFQSFDTRILQFCRARYPEVRLSLLVENAKTGQNILKDLGFVPDIYSPYFKDLDGKMVDEMHQKSMKVIPWTVNNQPDMERMLAIGVDGLITDYPDRFFALSALKR